MACVLLARTFVRASSLSTLIALASLVQAGCNCGSPASDTGTDSGGGDSASEGGAVDGSSGEGSDTDDDSASGSSGDTGGTGGEDDEVCGYAPDLFARSLGVGYVSGIAIGDIDADGVADIVVARADAEVPSAVSVLLAESPGVFSEPVDTVEDVAQSVGVGDFDEDGALDVLSVSYPSSAFVLAHVGGGALEVMSETPIGSNNCKDVEVADIDADGHLDFVTACEAQETTTDASEGVHVFRGLGDGTFEKLTALSMEEPVGTHLVDLDDDGLPDLVATAFASESDPEFFVFHNTGTGFEQAQVFPFTWGGDSSSGDFDEDGDADVIVASEFGGEFPGAVFYFENQGGVLADPVPFDVIGSPFVLEAGDFDLDGHLDFMTGGDGLMQVVLGDGNGGFTASAVHACGAGRKMAAGHLDDDGRIDIVHTASGGVAVRREDDDFFEQPAYVEDIAGVQHLELVDLDQDGHLDLATLSPTGVEAHRGQGDGTFVEVWSAELDTTGSFGVTGGDVDGDGVLDLVTATQGGVNWHAGTGDGTFAPAEELFATAAIGVPRFADLDNDGTEDVLVPRDLGVMIRLATGDITSRSGTGGGSSLAVLDVDDDGAIDVLTTGGGLRVLFGDGTGELADPIIVESEFGVGEVVGADVDGDGDIDGVAVGPHAQAGTTFRGLTVFVNDDGVFSPGVSTAPVGMDIHGLTVADLDGDGRDDIVSHEHASMAISLWSGPELTHGGVFPTAGIPESSPLTGKDGAAVGDVDEDGTLDILVADPYQDRVVIMRGRLLSGDDC